MPQTAQPLGLAVLVVGKEKASYAFCCSDQAYLIFSKQCMVNRTLFKMCVVLLCDLCLLFTFIDLSICGCVKIFLNVFGEQVIFISFCDINT
jgi:hypothetical protein